MQRFTLLTMLSTGLILGTIGCSGGSSDYKKTNDLKKAPAIQEPHVHGAKGPHGGSLVELGKDEFHGEVVVDHEAHALRVFVMDKDAKAAVPTTATEVTITPEGKDVLTLKAAPQDGDGEGKSSKFELVDDAAIHALLDAGMIHGTLKVTIGDKPFTGKIDYHLDDIHHEHKDEKPADKPKEPEAAKPADAANPEAEKDKPAETGKDKTAEGDNDKPAEAAKDKPAEADKDKPAETDKDKPAEGDKEPK